MKHLNLNLNLEPARWVWLPSERCLANTFVLFRKSICLDRAPLRALGWITADSRYRLTVNGRRIQWGPAPCDPRWQEADPVDLREHLQNGENVIGVEVCYFGAGDGTWVAGSPSMIFRLELDDQLIVSDASWLCRLDRAHRPGMYKRWFLRALQEEFDARLHPHGWDLPGHNLDAQWLSARELPGRPDLPGAFAGGPEYILGCDFSEPTPDADPALMSRPELRRRSIPLMREDEVSSERLADAGHVYWLRNPLDWFESRIPDSFRIQSTPSFARHEPDGAVVLPANPSTDVGHYLTYSFAQQIAGFPGFEIDAPEGAIIELIVQESHDAQRGPAWLDSYIFHWSRFICREGSQRFETFDYECFRWLQLHVRDATRPVIVRRVFARRRRYAYSRTAVVHCGEPTLQRVIDASVNTLYNSCQDNIQDGGGRERQQYSGDVGHQLQAVRLLWGEYEQPARYLRTYSQGLTREGYFLDCWPAFDRLARVMQRQMGMTVWGPLLDHGVGFVFDCHLHWMESGRLEDLAEPWPRLRCFMKYLAQLVRDDGLLPVENIGVPAVWIDHDAYRQQREKKLAFNLYTAAMLEHAFVPIAEQFRDTQAMEQAMNLSKNLLRSCVRVYWDDAQGVFVNNLPWRSDELDSRFDDRSLATSLLYDQCPGQRTSRAVELLAAAPQCMGLSYPANACWRYRALGRAGRVDVIIRDFHERWATMNSVIHNQTVQEVWHAKPDNGHQFSHCAVSPLFILITEVLGLRPLSPGFTQYTIQPQLADLPALNLTVHTPAGPIHFSSTYHPDRSHECQLTTPSGLRGWLGCPSRGEPLPNGGQKQWRAIPE